MSDDFGPDPQTEDGRLQRRLLQEISRFRTARHDPDDPWQFLLWVAGQARQAQAHGFQDLFALWVFGLKRGGWFVEIGAADGKKASNTWFLEKVAGWTGVLAEPNPAFWPSIEAERSARLFKKAVHPVSGLTLPFLATTEPWYSRLADIVPADSHEQGAREEHERILVETISPNDILLEAGAPERIDYLSVDTEGAELEILQALDFDRWDIRTITVEHNFTPAREALFELLSSRGYRRKWPDFSGFDDWYVKA